MYLKNLKVKDFRNFREDKVEFSNKINVFIGKNAQGKTSLLEAIYMLSLARSHRTFKEKEVIRFQTDYAQISGEVFKNNRRTSLSLTLTKQGKIAKVNHLQKNKLSDYIGTFNVILFDSIISPLNLLTSNFQIYFSLQLSLYKDLHIP